MRRAIALTAVLGALLIIPSASGLPPPASCHRCWNPKPTTQPWHWQLHGKNDLALSAPGYHLDMERACANVKASHDQNHRASCYLHVRAWEPYRSDAGKSPKRLLGRHFQGFPNERWLDIRALHVLKPILAERFDTCAAKGFDG